MPDYRRDRLNGGTYFFTVVTQNRMPIFGNSKARGCLRDAIIKARRRFPFEMWAFVLLPDHLHCIWNLPEDDADYSRRWSIIKRSFSQAWLASGGYSAPCSDSRCRHRELGVWQRRFWEHRIRNERELFAYRDYIHLNPVKHGYVEEPSQWKWSSVHRHIRLGWLEAEWTGATPIAIDVRGEA